MSRSHPGSLRWEGNNGTPGRAWPGSNWPQTSSTNQCRLRSAPLINGADQPRLGPAPPRALAVADVELAEPAQFPPDVVQVQHPGLVDPQADVGGQPGGRVVAGGRGELAAGGQFPAPPGEQLVDLRLGRRDAQLRIDRGPRRFISSSGHSTTRPVRLMQLDLVPQLQELEVHRQRCRPAGTRRRLRLAQHLAEVGIRVGTAASSTAACRTSPGSAPGGRCRCGSCCRPAPAEARARMNPASTSVSKSVSSSALAPVRCSRRSRTRSKANSCLPTSPETKSQRLGRGSPFHGG